MFKYNFLLCLFSVLAYSSLQAQTLKTKQPLASKTFVNNNSDYKISGLDKACWISDGRALPKSDSLFYTLQPAPVFRKEFVSTHGKVKKATLYITAAGYYKATINGEKIGYTSLEPAWTDFSKRVYYAEFDLTKEILVGDNCLGVELGNGFYNPLPLRMWGNLNLRDHLHVGTPVFIARLVITYFDGFSFEINTDQSWKYAYGPTMKNNVYLGTIRDARNELTGWNQKGFNDVNWKKIVIHNGPGGKLEKAFFPPIKINSQITPVSISSPKQDIFIVDMGENFAGSYKIRLKGKTGDSVVFRFGERVYANGELNSMTSVSGQIKRKGTGGPGAPEIAWQTDTYIFGNNTDVWYSPDFTFHAFRYMEIKGLNYKPELSDIKGLAMSTGVEQNNSFECSSQLLNKIQKMSVQTFRSNLFSVQSDCPAREKFGYGGDLNAVGESFMYNFDMQSFYRKTVYDWADAVNDTGFIDTAPFVGLTYCGISWESAFLITQYELLIYYNDVALVREMYQRDLQWMEKVNRIHPDGIVSKGLSDHEALIPSPVQLIGTLHYLKCAQIMSRFAQIMKDAQNERKFNLLAEELKIKLHRKFWEQPFDPAINKQTLFASLLYYGVISEKETKAVQDSLSKAISKGISGHLMTGIFGTKYILEATSANGMGANIFDVVNSTQYPGWGYMIDKGATTLWETWKESDNVYSNCHPMFGTVSEWFYRWLGGIQPNPAFPGFRKFVISPIVPSDLNFVKCTYRSPQGVIKSNWEKTTNGIRFDLTIPLNTSASFRFPAGKETTTIIEKLQNQKVVSKKVFRADLIDQELQGGNYSISVNR